MRSWGFFLNYYYWQCRHGIVLTIGKLKGVTSALQTDSNSRRNKSWIIPVVLTLCQFNKKCFLFCFFVFFLITRSSRRLDLDE